MEEPQTCLNINKNEAVGKGKLKIKANKGDSWKSQSLRRQELTEILLSINAWKIFSIYLLFIHLAFYLIIPLYSNMLWKV